MKQRTVANLSAKQLRQAANIKDKIEALQADLSQLLGGASTAEENAPAKKKRRRMSAAGRAKIVAAAKARWAKVRAAAK